jgi:hypothetical protein
LRREHCLTRSANISPSESCSRSSGRSPRILFLDIETKPAIIASFGIRDQHIGHKQIIQDGGTICVGVGWGDEKPRFAFYRPGSTAIARCSTRFTA